MKTGLAVIGFVVVALVVGTCVACNDDEDVTGLGRVELVSHEWEEEGGGQDYDGNWSNEDRNRNRGRDRGAFSPGPFRDSPVEAFNNACMPGATCHYDGRGDEPPPDREEPS